MSLPTNLKDLKGFKPSRAQLKSTLEEAIGFARLALSGKPLISVRDNGTGAVTLTEGYFGSKTRVDNLRFEDLPAALEHRLISEDAAMEAFRYMVKHRILAPAND
jgi:hypothetical protein